MNNDNHYRTQNLYEASYLMVKNFLLAGKERAGSKVTILFEDSSDLQKAVLSYYNNGLVEGKAYSDSYRSLKDFVFQR